jgi:hypothetical protein
VTEERAKYREDTFSLVDPRSESYAKENESKGVHCIALDVRSSFDVAPRTNSKDSREKAGCGDPFSKRDAASASDAFAASYSLQCAQCTCSIAGSRGDPISQRAVISSLVASGHASFESFDPGRSVATRECAGVEFSTGDAERTQRVGRCATSPGGVPAEGERAAELRLYFAGAGLESQRAANTKLYRQQCD